MMQSVPQTSKPRKAFYANLDNERFGILTMDDAGAVWFREHDTDALTLITPEMYPFVGVNGEVGLADTQMLRDGDRVRKCSQTLVAA